jgi:hypothetical protein
VGSKGALPRGDGAWGSVPAHSRGSQGERRTCAADTPAAPAPPHAHKGKPRGGRSEGFTARFVSAGLPLPLLRAHMAPDRVHQPFLLPATTCTESFRGDYRHRDGNRRGARPFVTTSATHLRPTPTAPPRSDLLPRDHLPLPHQPWPLPVTTRHPRPNPATSPVPPDPLVTAENYWVYLVTVCGRKYTR